MKFVLLFCFLMPVSASEPQIKTVIKQTITINGVIEKPICELCDKMATHIACRNAFCKKFCDDHKEYVEKVLNGDWDCGRNANKAQ